MAEVRSRRRDPEQVHSPKLNPRESKHFLGILQKVTVFVPLSSQVTESQSHNWFIAS
jgi:hypothetical protein